MVSNELFLGAGVSPRLLELEESLMCIYMHFNHVEDRERARDGSIRHTRTHTHNRGPLLA